MQDNQILVVVGVGDVEDVTRVEAADAEVKRLDELRGHRKHGLRTHAMEAEWARWLVNTIYGRLLKQTLHRDSFRYIVMYRKRNPRFPSNLRNQQT
jgi:hypothetical protein